MMDELELRKILSYKTTDILVGIIIELLDFIKEMEMILNIDNQTKSADIVDKMLKK